MLQKHAMNTAGLRAMSRICAIRNLLRIHSHARQPFKTPRARPGDPNERGLFKAFRSTSSRSRPAEPLASLLSVLSQNLHKH